MLLAKKQRMTQLFDEQGAAHPVTVLSVEPAVVTQIKTVATDGYSAVQVASNAQKPERVAKAQRGHIKKATGNDTAFRTMREFRTTEEPTAQPGDKLTLGELFTEGDTVRVSAVSKGKGFQGVVKRHGFGGGPRSHGQRHNERMPGSIGATGPQRVLKGTKMGGRMGGERVTMHGVTVIAVDADAGEIYLRGAVPGRRDTIVEVAKEV